MGGGDLNTKKSWHPSTFKNQERVWKAERAAEAERRRIADLCAEMSGERDREQLSALARRTAAAAPAASAGATPTATPTAAAAAAGDRLGWMYTQPSKSSNSEDFLLGKSIDKNYERLVAEEKPSRPTSLEHEAVPFSIRSVRGAGAGAAAEGEADVARKLQEDPLAAIRRRELEARAQLLQNPLRLQKLAGLLRRDQEERKEKKAKKSKKKNKADLDRLLAEKLTKLQDKKIDLASLLAGGSGRSDKSKKRRGRRESESDATPPPPSPPRPPLPPPRGGRERGGGGGRRAPSEREREARLRAMVSDAAERDAERARHAARHREEGRREEAAAARAGFDEQFATRQSARAAGAGASVAARLRANVYNIQRSHGHMETHFARR